MMTNEIKKFSRWEDVPENLKTRTSLKKMGLKPSRGQKPAGVKTSNYHKTPDYDLYDVAECVPNVISDKQRAAIEKAKEASIAKRTCKRCGWVEELSRDYRGKWRLINGICPNCKYEIEQEKMHEAREAALPAAIKWATEVLKTNAIIIDTRTITFGSGIFELAIIDMSANTLYNSRFSVETQLLSKDEFEEVVEILCGASKVIIYTADFDIAQLKRIARDYGIEVPIIETDYAMEDFAQFAGDWSNNYRDSWLMLWKGEKTALGDCLATLEVIKAMASADEEQTSPPCEGCFGPCGDPDCDDKREVF